MRRADRLFKIIQRLRRRRTVTTARDLAQALEVSERTIYRDIAHLLDSGVPIRGEAGVGYLLRPTYDLPPLMFDEQEIEALVLGARIVRSWSDPGLATAAEDALAKIEEVLPATLRSKIEATPLFAISLHDRAEEERIFAEIRQAIHDRRKLRLHYEDAGGAVSERVVRPLGLFYWGLSWTLAAWCELRAAFRSFRIDRIDLIGGFEVLDTTFEDEENKTLADLFRHYEQEGESA